MSLKFLLFCGVLVFVLLLPLAVIGCQGPPDQSQFRSLSAIEAAGEPVVRIYAAPLPGLNAFATHTWFVIYRPEVEYFDRWDLWQEPDVGEPSWGHVHKNLLLPDDGVGGGDSFVLAERSGADAEAVIAFIELESPSYPCRNTYRVFGPNSNTYPQWVLDNTDWDVLLPASAIGSAAVSECQE